MSRTQYKVHFSRGVCGYYFRIYTGVKALFSAILPSSNLGDLVFFRPNLKAQDFHFLQTRKMMEVEHNKRRNKPQLVHNRCGTRPIDDSIPPMLRSLFGTHRRCVALEHPVTKRMTTSSSHLGEVGGLARLVLGDLVHRVLGALLALAVGPPFLGNVHHLIGLNRCPARPMPHTNSKREKKWTMG